MVDNSRTYRAKLNIIITLLCQLLTMVCGIIVPKVLIVGFGSEAYGATASIAQFLGYIALLDGGISGIARAALYKPLAQNDTYAISEVIGAIKRFFRIIAYIFVIYVLVLACTYKFISHIEIFDWVTTFLLVVVISISTFAQYFIGISYSILLQAAQRTYITYLINIIATLFNTILIVALVRFGVDLITIKFISGVVFAIRPVLMKLYVSRYFQVINIRTNNHYVLRNKWTGLGQHLAYFLHSHTDIAVLTVLASLKLVSVYSVYYMVINAIQSIVSSFSSGMEAIFGDMYAKNELDKLNRSFDLYETLISLIAVIVFSTTSVMIIPFVKIYTNGVTDVNYIVPSFGLLLTIATFVTCLRTPYHNLVIAAGHFKETRLAAYGEAGLNIISSVILVSRYGLLGVALGTLLAVTYRFMFYVCYLRHHIINRPIRKFIYRTIVSSVSFVIVFFLGSNITSRIPILSFLNWVVVSIVVVIIAIIVSFIFALAFYRSDLGNLVSKLRIRRLLLTL